MYSNFKSRPACFPVKAHHISCIFVALPPGTGIFHEFPDGTSAYFTFCCLTSPHAIVVKLNGRVEKSTERHDCRAGGARCHDSHDSDDSDDLDDLDDSNSAAQGSYWKSWSSSQVLTAFWWLEGGCICWRSWNVLRCWMAQQLWEPICDPSSSFIHFVYLVFGWNNWMVLIQIGCFGGPKFGNLPDSITMWVWGPPMLTHISKSAKAWSILKWGWFFERNRNTVWIRMNTS